ncbi:rhomboid family intramembrane serine protease [Halosegnis rubeus]|jgi:membrane associated rhomboid family serine protease|uniref:Rhomboid family intramembrane serine protease n=1 Tax=Halosegnis rubeus TaxID=2212850 RepID=A0A5N5U2W1_9EURY|nr:rhomboid family intramembrane serine protease [Halosegnis rubeus]KAB7512815.1 rhomboid family intramembrane serine protease [Halosegnis rubeus]KAB7515048.1 rhomboid family intramembrane serine protease [Halosegnis rubeus]
MDPLASVSRILLVGTVLLSVGILLRLARPEGEWGRTLRSRLVLGVPWGTLLTILLVLAVYLFVQGGLGNWYRPVVIPFRSWSYFYPLGVLTSGLAHSGPGHLLGNLFGTVIFGALAEYAWSHFPTERGSSSFGSWRSNPFVRILAVPLVAVLLAVATGMFALGPVIGFSGVVFAFAGFALVRYPVVTLVLVVAGDLVNLGYSALRSPVFTASGSTRYVTPSWSDIAVQGHALGIFIGIVLAILLFRRRGELPSPGRIWLGTLGYAAAQGLWALYLFQGGDTYVLFRAVGVAAVFALAALVTLAAKSSTRPLLPQTDLTRRQVAVVTLVGVLALVAAIAVPYNLLVVNETATPAESVEIRDYTVFYGEDVPNQYVGAYDLPIYNASGVTTSGVIVASPDRQVWQTVIPAGRLADGDARTVRVGGVGWRDTVVAQRVQWNVVGNRSVYTVRLDHGVESTLAYTSDPSRATPTIDGRNVTVVSTRSGFRLSVTRRGTELGRTSIPVSNETTAVGGLSVENDEGTLVAVSGETRVPIARRAGTRGN